MRKEVIPLRIAICDDDLHWRRQILELTNAYATENPEYCISFTAFEWGSELMDAARKTGGFDVYILDILMHGMNGIELGSRLRQMGFDGKIIYMSSSQDYALEAFKVKACNYLLKPLSKDSFFAALDDVYNAIAERKNKSIIVRTRKAASKSALTVLNMRSFASGPWFTIWSVEESSKAFPSVPPFQTPFMNC